MLQIEAEFLVERASARSKCAASCRLMLLSVVKYDGRNKYRLQFEHCWATAWISILEFLRLEERVECVPTSGSRLMPVDE